MDERAQKRSTVRLGIRLIHKICPESHLSSGTETAAQQPTVTRSLRSRLSPKARKLIKQTSLIIHGSSKEGHNNNSNGSVKSIVEADAVDGFNRVSITIKHILCSCNVEMEETESSSEILFRHFIFTQLWVSHTHARWISTLFSLIFLHFLCILCCWTLSDVWWDAKGGNSLRCDD